MFRFELRSEGDAPPPSSLFLSLFNELFGDSSMSNYWYWIGRVPHVFASLLPIIIFSSQISTGFKLHHTNA